VSRRARTPLGAREARLAWLLMAPALATLTIVAAGPLAATFWESLHRHDLRLPWLGRPFIGLANYAEAVGDPRFQGALVHTLGFVAASVTLELVFGLALALALDAIVRGRALARVVVLLPWALPTVVAALVWRFMFDSQSGIVNALAGRLGVAFLHREWLAGPLAAWVPIVLGDVWKTTPFVALLLLAGLQGIDARLYEAARLDGAGLRQRFLQITLPLLRPAIVVALVFRTLDAFRVFDLVYVLTGGGPGTATEVVSVYAFTSLLQDLRFGYGSALSVLVFVVSFALALVYIRALGSPVREAS
jgi:ABC-type sugar transport system permease subunit